VGKNLQHIGLWRPLLISFFVLEASSESLPQGSHSRSGTSYPSACVQWNKKAESLLLQATWMSRDVLKEGNKTHFFLTVKGIGQMIAEKRESSDMRRAKHTTC
jgi:hypothetical protein